MPGRGRERSTEKESERKQRTGRGDIEIEEKYRIREWEMVKSDNVPAGLHRWSTRHSESEEAKQAAQKSDFHV